MEHNVVVVLMADVGFIPLIYWHPNSALYLNIMFLA